MTTPAAGSILLDDLRALIERRQLLVVVGAGMSVGATGEAAAASWTGLLRDGAERAEQVGRGLPAGWGATIRWQIESGNLDMLLAAAELITQALGGKAGGEYRRWLRESVGALHAVDRAAMEAFATLGVAIATTNYDSLLEEVIGPPPVTWREGARVQRVLRGDEPGILHLHGHWQDPESVVLGIRSYEAVLGNAAAQALQRAMVSVRSLLFVGFGAGLTDPNFGALREWLAETFPGSEYRHFRLCRDDELAELAAEHRQEERIMVLAYGARHDRLAPFLRTLVTLPAAASELAAKQPPADADGAAEPGGFLRADHGRPGRTSPNSPPAEASTSGADAESLAVERIYRRWLRDDNDRVDLHGFPDSPDRPQLVGNVQLRQLYIPLRLTQEIQSKAGSPPPPGDSGRPTHLVGRTRTGSSRANGGVGHSAMLDPPPQPSRSLKEDLSHIKRRPGAEVRLGERLRSSRRLVVLGPAGAGKTTMVRWLAVAYLLRADLDPAWQTFPGRATLPDEDLLPLIVRCKELTVSKDLPDSIEDVIRRSLVGAPLTPHQQGLLIPAVLQRIQDGTALFLFDGLDEIPEFLRSQFCERIERFHIAYPRPYMIVTSRPAAYRELPGIKRGFEQGFVAPLSRAEKDDFATRWAAAVEPTHIERRQALAQDFTAEIHSSPQLERLTSTPLLLTAMASIKRYGTGPLPTRRTALYREAVGQLLKRRRPADDYLTQEEAICQLHYIAFAMCERETYELSRDEIIDLLETMRQEIPRLRRLLRSHTPQRFLHLVEEQTDVLVVSRIENRRGIDTPIYAFRHSTFTEFLAGQALANLQFPGVARFERTPEHFGSLAGRLIEQSASRGAANGIRAGGQWVEALRVGVSLSYDETDAVLKAILTPISGEDPQVTQRPRAELAALCLADEPDEVSDAVADEVLEAFAAEVDESDGKGTSRVTSTDMVSSELARTEFRLALVSHLVAEMERRHGQGLTAVGGICAQVAASKTDLADWTRGAPTDWICDRAERLRSHEPGEAVPAALEIVWLAFKGRRTTELTDALLEQLTAERVIAVAAAWALYRLTFREWGSVWNFVASNEQAERLVAAMTAGALDADVYRYLFATLGNLGHPHAMTIVMGAVDSPQELLRAAAPDVLLKLRPADAFDVLGRLLDDGSSRVRANAVRALEELGDARSIPPLVHRLQDGNAEVRVAAAYALGTLEAETALEDLLGHLSDDDSSVRAACVWALGHLGGNEAAERLVDRLNSDPDSDVRRAVIRELPYVAGDEAVELLDSLLDDEDIREAALTALAELGTPAAAEVLIARLGNGAVELQGAVAQLLKTLTDEIAGQLLVPIIESPDAPVRRVGCQLALQLLPSTGPPLLVSRISDPDTEVRLLALRELAERETDVAVPVEQLALLIDDLDPSIRELVATILVEGAAVAEAAGPMRRLIADPVPSVRAKAVASLAGLLSKTAQLPAGRTDTQGLGELLLPILSDDEGVVREAAVIAVGEVMAVGAAGLDIAEAVAALGTRLRIEPIGEIRRLAVITLGSLGGNQVTDPLADALGDPDTDVASSAARLLGRQDSVRAADALAAHLRLPPSNLSRPIAEAARGWLDRHNASWLERELLVADRADRRRVAAAMRRPHDGPAVVSFLERLSAIDDTTWRAAVGALGRVGRRRDDDLPILHAREDGDVARAVAALTARLDELRMLGFGGAVRAQPLDDATVLLGDLAGVCFVVLLPDVDDASGLARLLEDVQVSDGAKSATFVAPPVLGKAFFADHRVQTDIDTWWATAVPLGHMPVYLVMHEEGLRDWLTGLNAITYVGLPNREAVDQYTHLERVESFVASSPLDFATVITQDFSGSGPNYPILFDEGEALRMAALSADFPINLEDNVLDIE